MGLFERRSFRNLIIGRCRALPFEWLRVVWQDTGASLKKVWIALWGTGIIFLGLGWLGDSVSFWVNKPFLTNVLSALTGAAFGIPLALVFLQRITARETDAAQKRAAYQGSIAVTRRQA
jgi:hypothetical protein